MPHSPAVVERGYLLLADISGYTAFVAQTELEHSQEILTDLLETILQRLKTLLTIHKLGGDSIFAYARDAAVLRGETLLELIEATYADFRGRMKNVRRHTTCSCRACQSIPMLDLKFIVHHGEYAMQQIGGRPELAGSDVNLAHRLLKNQVTEKTGWRGYALLTSAALQRMGLQLESGYEGAESYEHLGETRIVAIDLRARHDALMEARRRLVEPEEALYSVNFDFPAAPPVVWSWLNDAQKRALAFGGTSPFRFIPIVRPGGRTGAGAVTHCVHGTKIEMSETVLDWKPFDYYTVEQDNGLMGIVQITTHLKPLDDGGTRMTLYLTGRVPNLPDRLGRPLIKFMFSRVFRYDEIAVRMRKLMEQENPDQSIVPGA